jgi:DNA recombination protein RmuC
MATLSELHELWLISSITLPLICAAVTQAWQIHKLTKKMNEVMTTQNHNSEQQNQNTQHILTRLTESHQQLLNLQNQANKSEALMHTLHKQSLLDQQQNIRNMMQDIRSQLATTLQQQNQSTNQIIRDLQKTVDSHLHHITGQVEKRLSDGFAKTNTIFTDVIKRLALIDKAQQEITDLSTNVVSLQDILRNRQARGHFGEIQLNQLIKNCLPEQYFSFQHTFKNGKRADCVLFLPEPTGTIAIDAKFPLENYRATCDSSDAQQKKLANSRFKQDMKVHIKDVAEKYIIANETCQAAVLFIPAESIFSEIYAHHNDLIDFAYQRKVWLVSPTTMMAILHTTQAVLKDIQTQAQVGIIKEHLQHLATDFQRFEQRMDSVAKHLNEANNKVGQVKISANKISKRFRQIERADLESEPASPGTQPALLEELAKPELEI